MGVNLDLIDPLAASSPFLDSRQAHILDIEPVGNRHSVLAFC